MHRRYMTDGARNFYYILKMLRQEKMKCGRNLIQHEARQNNCFRVKVLHLFLFCEILYHDC